jgi:O-antigen/teichoic acid export membrane protein
MIVRNYTFNLLGRLLPAACSLVAIPFYVRYLGISNYGLVGIFTAFTAIAGIFDSGFSTSINRELAKNSAAPIGSLDLATLFRTLEVFAWLVGVALAIGLFLLAGPFVHYWLSSHAAPTKSLLHGVELMSLLLMVQVPTSFYNGALYGMHMHGAVNIGQVANSFFSAIATIVVLALFSATLEAFLITQFLCRLSVMLAVRHVAVRKLLLRADRKGMHLSLRVWRTVWRFTIGMNGIGFLGLFASQADIFALSYVLPLKQVGYYTLARAIAQGIMAFSTPVFQTSFPEFSRLFGLGAEEQFLKVYHRYCEILAILTIPTSVVLMVYAHDVLRLWTHNLDIADHATGALTFLAAAWGLNGLGTVAYAFMLSRGIVRITFFIALANLVLIVPAFLFLAPYGPTGGAVGWFLVNCFCFFVGTPLMYYWYMRQQFVRWISVDVALPLVAALTIALIIKFAIPVYDQTLYLLARLVAAGVASVIGTAVVLPEGRRAIAYAYRLLSLAWTNGRPHNLR